MPKSGHASMIPATFGAVGIEMDFSFVAVEGDSS
jgi:hypothetical protein